MLKSFPTDKTIFVELSIATFLKQALPRIVSPAIRALTDDAINILIILSTFSGIIFRAITAPAAPVKIPQASLFGGAFSYRYQKRQSRLFNQHCKQGVFHRNEHAPSCPWWRKRRCHLRRAYDRRKCDRPDTLRCSGLRTACHRL